MLCLQLGGSRRLRVGYVSYVFGEHPTAHLIYGALAHHNRRRIASACFALNPPDGSAARAKLVAACDTFADLAPLSVGASCGAVNAARMHVLVNLDGWTSLGRTNEIFVCGAAPRQLAYLGYPATLALESVTHFATDALSSPADSQVRSPWAPGAAAPAATAQRTVAAALRHALQDHYTEKLVYIAGGYYTADYGAYGAYRSADESGRPIGHDRRLRVCNYNNLYKVRARTLTTARPAQRSSLLVRLLSSLTSSLVCLFVCLRLPRWNRQCLAFGSMSSAVAPRCLGAHICAAHTNHRHRPARRAAAAHECRHRARPQRDEACARCGTGCAAALHSVRTVPSQLGSAVRWRAACAARHACALAHKAKASARARRARRRAAAARAPARRGRCDRPLGGAARLCAVRTGPVRRCAVATAATLATVART